MKYIGYRHQRTDSFSHLGIRWITLLLLGFPLFPSVLGQSGPPVYFGSTTSATPEDAIVLPEPIPDPLEKVNRRIFAFNKVAITDVVKPSAKVYRSIVLPPLRASIGNAGR